MWRSHDSLEIQIDCNYPSACPNSTGPISWERMIRAVEKVRARLDRAVAALEGAGIPYAVAGGNAVAAWVSRVDEAAVRNTQDVDILLRRDRSGASQIRPCGCRLCLSPREERRHVSRWPQRKGPGRDSRRLRRRESDARYLAAIARCDRSGRSRAVSSSSISSHSCG